MNGDSDGTSDVEVPPSPARPARLHPFRALRLAPGRVTDQAVARSLSRPYRDAAQRVARWEADGRLERDLEPALHLHEYSSQGMTVRGIVGALDLSTRASSLEDSAVLPHEAIHALQADELSQRMLELRLNPAPILLVHRGTPESRATLDTVAAGPAERAFTDASGQQHRFWRVTDPGHLDVVTETLARNALLIADGHHRYAAYLRLQERLPGTGWDRGLAMVVDQEDTPFFLGAVHRVLRGLDLDALAEAARATGSEVSFRTEHAAVEALSPHTWVATDARRWMTVRQHAEALSASALDHLHGAVLPTVSGSAGHQTLYRHNVEAALGDLEAPGVAVIMPAPDFDLVDRVLRTGRLLPEKATSFQPKPTPGVIMRAIEDE